MDHVIEQEKQCPIMTWEMWLLHWSNQYQQWAHPINKKRTTITVEIIQLAIPIQQPVKYLPNVARDLNFIRQVQCKQYHSKPNNL